MDRVHSTMAQNQEVCSVSGNVTRYLRTSSNSPRPFTRRSLNPNRNRDHRIQCAPELSNDKTLETGSKTLLSTPWDFGFQCNERYLEWDLSAQRRLMKLVASGKLGIGLEELDERIEELMALLPDMAGKMGKMKADILVEMLKDTQNLTSKMLVLKEALPDTNVSRLIARFPNVVVEFSVDELEGRLKEMGDKLVGVDLGTLLDKEPRFLTVDLDAVLENLERLMPGKNPVESLVNFPELVLSMEEVGLASAIDIEE